MPQSLAPGRLTSFRVSKAGNYGAASILWLLLTLSFSVEVHKDFSNGDCSRALLMALNCLGTALCHVSAASAFLLATWSPDWVRKLLCGREDDLEWLYVYVFIPLVFQLSRFAPLGSGPDYFLLFFFHCNFGTVVGFTLSEALAGWAVLAPLYVYWDLYQWHAAGSPAIFLPISSSTPNTPGSLLLNLPLAAAAWRAAALLAATLASLLTLQLAFSPALAGRVNAPAAHGHDPTIRGKQGPLAPSPRTRGGPGAKDSTRGRQRHIFEALRASAETLDQRFYSYSNSMLRAVPLGVLVVATCLPYVLGMFVLACWRIGTYGDAAARSSFAPSQVMLSLLAAFMLGRTDLQDVLRRLSKAEEVLYDLVPRHVAALLLDTRQRHQPQPGQQQQQAGGGDGGGSARLCGSPLQRTSGSEVLSAFSDCTVLAASRPGSSSSRLPDSGSFISSSSTALQAADLSLPLPAPSFWRTSTGSEGSRLGGGWPAVERREGQGVPTRGAEPEPPHIAEWHEGVTVLFADIRGFTDMARQVEPFEVMRFLNRLYHRFDTLACTMEGIYKVETVGDCYMCASGLLEEDEHHALTMLRFAAAMQQAAEEVLLPHSQEPVQIRVGVHSGRVMSGVVGSIRKRYCLFGDTVNTASRLETTGTPGRIHVSSDTYLLALRSGGQAEFQFEAREPIEVKGKGVMQTYFASPWQECQYPWPTEGDVDGSEVTLSPST